MENEQLNSSCVKMSTSDSPESVKVHKPKPPTVPPKPSKSRHSVASTCSFVSQNDSLLMMTNEKPDEKDLTFCSSSEPTTANINDSPQVDTETKTLKKLDFNFNPYVEDRSEGFESPISTISIQALRRSKSVIVNQPSSWRKGGNDNFNTLENECKCPYNQLHHSTPCEFLSLPQIGDEAKNLLLGIDDLSSKVDDKIRFIVANLKMCGGIWPLMFMEKLNRIIVHADLKAVKACFQEEDFSLVYKLIELYAEEQRCSVVFRYWCTFYNILSRNLVPFPVFAQSELVNLLKRDFTTAAEGQCRCKSDLGETISSPGDKADEEHATISPKIQMEIIAILLNPLFTARAGLELSLDLKNETEFALRVLKVINSQEEMSLVPISKDKSPMGDTDPEKNILVHLLLAFNLQFPSKAQENPLVEAISSEDFAESSLFKRKLLTIFLQEFDLLNKGCLDGISSLISSTAPLGFQTAGVNGPLKMYIDMMSSDKWEFFTVDDLRFLLTVTMNIQKLLSQDGFWDDKTEEIFNNCRMLQGLLDFRLGYFQSEIDLNANASGLESESERSEQISASLLRSNSETSDWESTEDLLNPGDMQKRLSDTKVAQKSSDGFLKPRIVMMWPVEAVMKCFGCAKKKSSSVSPASKTEIEEGYV